MKKLRAAWLEDTGIGVEIGEVNNLRYADDTTIITEDLIDLELLVNKVKYPSANVCLKLYLAETKGMTTEKSQNFKIEGQGLEVVECYTFLGLTVTKDGICMKENQRRIMMGKSAMSKLERICKDKSN